MTEPPEDLTRAVRRLQIWMIVILITSPLWATVLFGYRLGERIFG